MSVVCRGSCTVTPHDTDENPQMELSTPYTRSYARWELRRSWAVAARRRMTTMLVLLGLMVLSMVLAITDVTPWWLVAIFALLLVGFFALARWSVVAMAKRFDRRYALIDKGWDEDTVALEVGTEPFRAEDESTSWTIDLDRPVTAPEGSLWDDVVVTAPTYVSTPLGARTVRTIDLSAPGPFPVRSTLLSLPRSRLSGLTVSMLRRPTRVPRGSSELRRPEPSSDDMGLA